MKKSLIALAVLAAAAASTGCASVVGEGKLANRVVCTVARDQAYVVSEYGPVGISSKVDARDGDVICAMAPKPAAGASAAK